MDWNFSKGEIVIIELINETFVGEFYYTDLKRTRIHLSNVKDYYNQSEYDGIQIYYKSEIKSIRLFKNDIEDENKLEKTSANIKLITLIEINNIISNYKFIFQINKEYYASIEKLKTKNIIGLHVEGDSDISIIAISTDNDIFLIDMLALNKIPNDLKQIFEDINCIKVMHDCRKTAHTLKSKHDINLCNVFDTLIAHVQVSLKKDKKKISLEECITNHFKLPSRFIQPSKNNNWCERPLATELKNIAVQNVGYLIELSTHLEKLLLKPYYDNVDIYMKSLDNFENAMHLEKIFDT